MRSLSCSGLGYKCTEQGWTVLSALITADEDPNVRAEAANALAVMGGAGLAAACGLKPMTPGWCAAAFCPSWRNSPPLIWAGCWSWRPWRSPTPMARCG